MKHVLEKMEAIEDISKCLEGIDHRLEGQAVKIVKIQAKGEPYYDLHQ